jgi:hypothetical protein
VDITPADLTGPEGAVLSASAARLYRQHQLHLTVASYRNADFKEGWYPDPLIPFVHPVTGRPLRGARFQAVPFDLPAGETHGFLVDVFVPPDAKPGTYHGAYTVKADGRETIEIPVTLTVWDFALPATPTLKTAFGSPVSSIRRRSRTDADANGDHPVSDERTAAGQCAEMLAAHHINATPGPLAPQAQPDGSFLIPASRIDAVREFVDRYHVNAIQIVHPKTAVDDPERERERLNAWLAAWDRAIAQLDRPEVVFYTYLLDEPNDREAYQYVQKWGRAIREAKTKVRILVVEQPQTQDPAWGDLHGAVDIWCPLFCLFEPGPAADRQALGEMIWTYTALCQGKQMTPWWQTDFPLLHYRVPAWISWRYRIRGLLYWGGLSFWDHAKDPWTVPETYDMRKKEGRGAVYNGEGCLVYPGRDVGYDGIAPSLRLKALRDSIEDYEYLAILERLGRAAEAERIVLPLADSWYHWDHDPAAYQKARAALAELIVKASCEQAR